MTNQIQTRQKDTASQVGDLLAKAENQIKSALAEGIDFDRLARVSVSQIRKTPALMRCSAVSLASAIQESGKLGLEPGLLGQAYLVPYGSECTLIVGYRGLIDLARRSGDVLKIEARTVHANDVFDVEFGSADVFRHKPDLFGDRGELIGVYAEATLKSGVVQRDFMTRREVDAIRARSKAGKSGPWVTDYAEMAKKTVVRRLIKMLPLAIDDMRRISAADDLEFGGQFHDARAEKAVTSAFALPEAPSEEEAVEVETQDGNPAPVPVDTSDFTDDELGGR